MPVPDAESSLRTVADMSLHSESWGSASESSETKDAEGGQSLEGPTLISDGSEKFRSLQKGRQEGYLGTANNDPLFKTFSDERSQLDSEFNLVLKQLGPKKSAGFFNTIMSYLLPDGEEEKMKQLEILLDANTMVESKTRDRLRKSSRVLGTTAISRPHEKIHGSGARGAKPPKSSTRLEDDEDIPKPNPNDIHMFRKNSSPHLKKTTQDKRLDPENIPRQVATLARRLTVIREKYKKTRVAYEYDVAFEHVFTEARKVILAMSSHTYLHPEDVEAMCDQLDHLFCYLFTLECNVHIVMRSPRLPGDLDVLGKQTDKLLENVTQCGKRFEAFVANIRMRDNYLAIGVAPKPPSIAKESRTETRDFHQISSELRDLCPIKTAKDYNKFVETALADSDWGTDRTQLLQEHEKAVMDGVAKKFGNKDLSYDDAITFLSEGVQLQHITVFQDEISTQNMLGRGAFGHVLMNTRINTKERVAIKIVKPTGDKTVQFPRRLLVHEAMVWHDLEHPNILPLIGYTVISVDNERFIGLVSAECVKGNLWEYKRNGHAEKLITMIQLLRGIANALCFLHSQRHKAITHGDLRAVNILVDNSGNCRLCDFGLSTVTESKTGKITAAGTTTITNIHWLAPELVGHGDGSKAAEMANTPATDMYAFGCVAQEVFTTTYPYSWIEEADIICMKISGQLPERPSALTADHEGNRKWAFMVKHWNNVPGSRPSARETYEELCDWFDELYAKD